MVSHSHHVISRCSCLRTKTTPVGFAHPVKHKGELMKLLSLILALFLTGNVLASTNTAALEELIDNYRYEVEVEWDQKDPASLEKMKNSFVENAAQLIAESDLSEDNLVVLIQKKIKDPKQAEAILLKMRLLSKSSPAEIASVLSSSSQEFYSRGASWSGDDEWKAYGTILIAVVLGVLYGLYQRNQIVNELNLDGEYVCYQYGYANECTTNGSWYGNTWKETTSCANVYQCLSGGLVKK